MLEGDTGMARQNASAATADSAETSNEQGYADRAWVRWTSDKKTMFSGSYGYNGYLYSDAKFSEPGDPRQQQLFPRESAIQKPVLTPVFCRWSRRLAG